MTSSHYGYRRDREETLYRDMLRKPITIEEYSSKYGQPERSAPEKDYIRTEPELHSRPSPREN